MGFLNIQFHNKRIKIHCNSLRVGIMQVLKGFIYFNTKGLVAWKGMCFTNNRSKLTVNSKSELIYTADHYKPSVSITT